MRDLVIDLCLNLFKDYPELREAQLQDFLTAPDEDITDSTNDNDVHGFHGQEVV